MKCWGDKDHCVCEGEVRRYRIAGWGTFQYCDAHAQYDRQRGHVLTRQKQEGGDDA